MLKSEVKSIGKLDMSKFGCDFKSKNLAYGAERLKTDKGYNLDIINRYDCGASGMPELPAIDCKPGDFMGFNYAKSTSSEGYKFTFNGVPKGSTVATSTVGIQRDKNARKAFKSGLKAAIKAVQPTRLLLYGGTVDFDFGDIEVLEYKNHVTDRMTYGW